MNFGSNQTVITHLLKFGAYVDVDTKTLLHIFGIYTSHFWNVLEFTRHI